MRVAAWYLTKGITTLIKEDKDGWKILPTKAREGKFVSGARKSYADITLKE